MTTARKYLMNVISDGIESAGFAGKRGYGVDPQKFKGYCNGLMTLSRRSVAATTADGSDSRML